MKEEERKDFFIQLGECDWYGIPRFMRWFGYDLKRIRRRNRIITQVQRKVLDRNIRWDFISKYVEGMKRRS